MHLAHENGHVTNDDINVVLPDGLSPEDLDELYTKLRGLDIEIVDQAEVERAKPAEPEEDEDQRLEVLDDPVRMYMNQMGKVPLLTREQEVEICKRIEDAELEMKAIVYSLGFAAKEHIAIAEKLLSEPPKERFDRVVVDKKVANREGHLRDLRSLIKKVPYTPLGGWYRPGADLDAATSALWFQNDFVHAGPRVPGSDLFLWHERVIEAARRFYAAEVIVPHSVYVNWMAAIERAGPAHTDNPRFHGRDRSNPPMWLLRVMFWSGLFDRWAIAQATSIWWMNDVEGGEFVYWPEGPDKPPQRRFGEMANTAHVGDNHGMFHQVGPVGPFDRTLRVTPRA